MLVHLSLGGVEGDGQGREGNAQPDTSAMGGRGFDDNGRGVEADGVLEVAALDGVEGLGGGNATSNLWWCFKKTRE